MTVSRRKGDDGIDVLRTAPAVVGEEGQSADLVEGGSRSKRREERAHSGLRRGGTRETQQGISMRRHAF
jgi:hypothetical protein